MMRLAILKCLKRLKDLRAHEISVFSGPCSEDKNQFTQLSTEHRALNTNKGSILVAVLWSLFFLASLAMVISASIEPQLVLAARLRDRTVLRQWARAAVARAAIELRADETDGYDGYFDSWSHNEEAFKNMAMTDGGYFSLEYSLPGEEGTEEETDEENEGTRYYGLMDEEGRININKVPANVLARLFELAAEMSSQEAADLADAIVDWRDEDDDPSTNGAENSYYEALDPSYACKNADFEVAEELFLVRDMTSDIFEKIEPYITVYGKGKININTADQMVLQAAGMRESLAEKVLTFRKGDDGMLATDDDNAFNSTDDAANVLSSKAGLNAEEVTEFEAIIEEGLVGVSSDVFRGYSFGRFQDSEISSELVFVIGRDEKIRYWREK